MFRYQDDRRLKEESRLRELNRRNNDFNNSRKRSNRSNRHTERDAIEMQNRRNMEREDSISSTSESSSSSSSSIEEDFSRRRGNAKMRGRTNKGYGYATSHVSSRHVITTED